MTTLSTHVDDLDRERLLLVEDYLDSETCRLLREELVFAWWRPSLVVNRSPNGEVVEMPSEARVSQGTTSHYFSDAARAAVDQLEARICADFGVLADHLETWQAISYTPGGHFDQHHDAGLFGFEPQGERTTSIMLYLATPGAGGQTEFPELGRSIEAREGRLVIWRNLKPGGWVDPAMVHQAMPLISGEKSILLTWERENSRSGQAHTQQGTRDTNVT